jgi:hypothetical protein
MAIPAGYELRYRGGTYNEGLGNCYVDIYKKGYTESQEDPITIQEQGITLITDKGDYFEPIKSSSVSINIINDKANFYEFDDLFSISDLEYYVRVHTDNLVLFAGYIPCTTVEQTWLKNGIVELNATCNLNRLSEYCPTLFVTKGLYSLIEIIQNCLSFTHMDLCVNVNCSLSEQNIGGIPFEVSHIDSDLFYKNNIELDDCGTVLKKILTSFDCTIYYYDDEWWIERLNDAGSNDLNWYKFDVNSSASVLRQQNNIHLTIGTELIPCNMSQKIGYIPGFKKIELTLKEKRKINYLSYYFSPVTQTDPLSSLELMYPAIGCWEAVNEGVDLSILPIANYCNINNGVYIGDYSHSGDYEYMNGCDEENFPYDPPGPYWYAMRHSLFGISSAFNLTLNETSPTSINIALKFAIHPSFLNVFTFFASDRFIHPNDHKFYVRFYIGNGNTSSWLHMNSTTNKYEFRQRNDLISYGGAYDLSIISVEVPYDSFTDKVGLYHEFSTSLTLEPGILDSDASDMFVFGLCELGYNNPLYCTGDLIGRMNKPNQAYKHWYVGDIFITATDDLGDNVIIGDISNDFIDVGKVDVDLYDAKSYSLLNCLYVFAPTYDQSIGWRDSFHPYPAPALPLVKWMIRDRFQIFNKTRREITSDFKSNTFMPPFRLVEAKFGETFPGIVSLLDDVSVFGVDNSTTFLTTFKVGDWIKIEGQLSQRIVSIDDDTHLDVAMPGYDISSYPYPAYPSGLTYERRKLFFVDGYQYNLQAGMYESMSLKEYVNDDGIS